jgi:two-component system, OmpR family, KDP operon response regulator KdpE
MSENQPRILIIEDDPPIRRFLRASLTSHDYDVADAETGKDGLTQAAQQPPELVILDLGLPDMDGVEVIRRLRDWSSVPIIIVSARGQEKDKVAALDAGADDYLTKPFGIGELLARLRVAMRHSAIIKDDSQAASQFVVGNLKVDLTLRRVFVGDNEIHLTPLEYRLLTILVQHAGKVLTHQFLLKEIWGPSDVDQTHYLRIFMANLRRKIELDPAQPRYLLTEQGIGYRLTDE